MAQTPDEKYKARQAERERQQQERMPKPRWWLGQREPIARFTAYVVVFTAGLVAVGVLQWCSLNGQQTIMKGQLKEMQAEQRPWIGTIARPEGIITSSGQWVKPEILISIKNYGHSPAFRVGSHTETIGLDEAVNAYGDVKGPKASLCAIAELAAITADKAPELPDYGFVVFPEITSRIGNRVLTPISYSFPMEQQLAVIGCLAYVDQLHKSGSPIHHTSFCFMTSSPIKTLMVDGTIHLDEHAAMYTCTFFQGAD